MEHVPAEIPTQTRVQDTVGHPVPTSAHHQDHAQNYVEVQSAVDYQVPAQVTNHHIQNHHQVSMQVENQIVETQAHPSSSTSAPTSSQSQLTDPATTNVPSIPPSAYSVSNNDAQDGPIHKDDDKKGEGPATPSTVYLGTTSSSVTEDDNDGHDDHEDSLTEIMGENNEVDYIDNNQNVRQAMLARHKILHADKVQIIRDINSEQDPQRANRVRAAHRRWDYGPFITKLLLLLIRKGTLQKILQEECR